MISKKFETQKKLSEKRAASVESPRVVEKARATSPRRWTGLIRALIVVLVALLITAGGYSFWRWQTSPENQVARVVTKVAQKMELPASIPTVATVTDKTKLANQEFFLKAENGDQILIYPDAEKAILYRPSIDKIVEVAPIKLTSENSVRQATETASSSAKATTTAVRPSLTATVGLYNGTNTVGLTRRVEAFLADILDAQIIFRGNALERTYTETVVVDTTGLQAAEAQQLADVLGGRVGDLPAIEATPSADIVVFIGSDFADRPQ